MFNQELNDKSTNKLREYCKGKRVLLVGNAASLFNHEYGKIIDEYDVVVRFGKGIPTEDNEKHIGSKTDVWFFGSLRASMHEHWRHKARFKVFNYTQIGLYDPRGATPLTFPNCMATKEFQIYRDYFIIGDAATHKTLISKIYQMPKTNEWRKAPRISQGVLGFLYFKEVISTYSQMDLVGFDFFTSTVRYELDGKEKRIYSWHVPIPIDNYEANPHGGDFEKDYVLKEIAANKNLNIYDMNSDISFDTNKLLVNKFRPGAVPK